MSFEAYCASTVDPASRLITHGIAEGMGGRRRRVRQRLPGPHLLRGRPAGDERDAPRAPHGAVALRDHGRRARAQPEVQGAPEALWLRLRAGRRLRRREPVGRHGPDTRRGGPRLRRRGDRPGEAHSTTRRRRSQSRGPSLACGHGARLPRRARRADPRPLRQDRLPHPLGGTLALGPGGPRSSWRHENIPMAVRMVSGALRHALAPAVGQRPQPDTEGARPWPLGTLARALRLAHGALQATAPARR